MVSLFSLLRPFLSCVIIIKQHDYHIFIHLYDYHKLIVIHRWYLMLFVFTSFYWWYHYWLYTCRYHIAVIIIIFCMIIAMNVIITIIAIIIIIIIIGVIFILFHCFRHFIITFAIICCHLRSIVEKLMTNFKTFRRTKIHFADGIFKWISCLNVFWLEIRWNMIVGV